MNSTVQANNSESAVVFLFDIGGVVVKLRKKSPFLLAISEECGVGYKDLRSRTESYLPELEEGTLTAKEFLNVVLRDTLCSPCTNVRVKHILDRSLEPSTTPNIGVLRIITKAKRYGFRTYALTNSFSEQIRYIRSRRWSTLFEKIFASCELGVRKPAPEIFWLVASSIGCAVNNIIYVDNENPNLAGARRAGVTKLIHYKNVDDLRLRIEHLLAKSRYP